MAGKQFVVDSTNVLLELLLVLFKWSKSLLSFLDLPANVWTGGSSRFGHDRVWDQESQHEWQGEKEGDPCEVFGKESNHVSYFTMNLHMVLFIKRRVLKRDLRECAQKI